jgi:hypothetical protein
MITRREDAIGLEAGTALPVLERRIAPKHFPIDMLYSFRL